MRRCLCPSGLLRASRGSRLSRSPPSLYPTLFRLHTRSISSHGSGECQDVETRKREAFLSYISRQPRPPAGVGASQTFFVRFKWLPFLFREYIKIRKRRNRPNRGKPDVPILENKKLLTAVHRMKGVMAHARQGPNFPLLNTVGFIQRQWSHVYGILGILVDTYEQLLPHMVSHQNLPTAGWLDSELSLDDLADMEDDDIIKKRLLIPINPSSTAPTLDNITGAQPVLNQFADSLLEETVVNLGLLVLEAASSQDPKDAAAAMSCVHRILARLHHLDLISDRVYQAPDPKFHQSSIRPPGLHLLSGHIMSVLSDAAWLEHEAALTAEAKAAGDEPPFVPFKVGVRELGPEIWFELILWICVEHGFNKPGAWLVQQMTKSPLRWKIESWAPLMDALEVVQQTSINTEKAWRRPGMTSPIPTFTGKNKPPFCGLGPRTISAEVISSVRSGLSNNAYNGIGFHGPTPSALLRDSAPLTALLDPPGTIIKLDPTNKLTTENIVRILESGCLSPSDDPIAFANVLKSTRKLVPPLTITNDTKPEMEELQQMTKAQLYGQTAALAGLVEYSIKSASHKGLAYTAFNQYALRQSIDDASKVYHIEAFFEQLKQRESIDVPFFDSQQFDSSQFQQSSNPQVSYSTFADLLDLAKAAHSFDFGNWLLFNDDIDGPAIPPAAYGKMSLAPALLRFATATKNKKLSDSVIQSLEMPLTVNILKAMATVHIEFCDWENARLTFEYLRDYRLKSWGYSNLMALGAKIVKLEAALEEAQLKKSPDQEKISQDLSRGTEMLAQFFNGDFNTRPSKHPNVTAFQRKVLQRTKSIFREIPGALSRTVHAKLKHKFSSREQLPYVPHVSFNSILAAVTESRGVEAGKALFFKFARNFEDPDLMRRREGGVERLQLIPERDWLQGDPTFSSTWHQHVLEKATVPNLNAVRILARAANLEYQQYITQKIQNPDSIPPSSNFSRSGRLKSSYKLSVEKKIFEHQSQDGGLPPSSLEERNLDICVDLFLKAGMPEEQIEFEVPGHLARLRMRGVFTAGQAKRVRDRYKEVQDGPWMKSFVESQSKVLHNPLETESVSSDPLDSQSHVSSPLESPKVSDSSRNQHVSV